MSAIVQLDSKPIPIIAFRRLVRRPAPAERIKDDVPWVCRDANGSFGDHKFQFVYTRPNFEFLMAIR